MHLEELEGGQIERLGGRVKDGEIPQVRQRAWNELHEMEEGQAGGAMWRGELDDEGFERVREGEGLVGGLGAGERLSGRDDEYEGPEGRRGGPERGEEEVSEPDFEAEVLKAGEDERGRNVVVLGWALGGGSLDDVVGGEDELGEGGVGFEGVYEGGKTSAVAEVDVDLVLGFRRRIGREMAEMDVLVEEAGGDSLGAAEIETGRGQLEL